MPDDTKALERARWVAELAIAYTDNLTSAQRLKLLNTAYDVAHAHGVCDGIDRALDGMKVA